MRWYLQVIKNYANFNGRARRKEYWMFYLFSTIFEIVAIILDNVLGITFHVAGIYQYVGPIYLIYRLLLLIPGIALVVRRLHDQDKSGAWYFISCVPLIGGIWLLVLMCTEGTYGPNQYDEDPKQQGDANSFVDAPVVDAPLVEVPIVHSPVVYTPIVHTPERTKYILDSITITGLKLSKTQAASGEAVLAEISCQNSGAETKEYMLTLYVNGIAMQKQQINIPPNSQGSVVMQVPPRWDIGEYTVKVGSYSQKLTIL